MLTQSVLRETIPKRNEKVEINGKKYSEYRDGYDAVSFSNAMNCWVRNLRVTDFDSAVRMQGIHNTAVNLELAEDQDKHLSHYALDTGNFSQYNLFHDVRVINKRVVHHFAIGSGHGQVFSKLGKEGGNPPDIDMHKEASDCLWTDIVSDTDMSRLSGTSHTRKLKKSLTIWNVQANGDGWDRDVHKYTPDWGSGGAINFVGIKTRHIDNNTSDPDGSRGKAWVEKFDPGTLEPRNLYLAQLARRFGDSDDTPATAYSPIESFGDVTNWTPKTDSRWSIASDPTGNDEDAKKYYLNTTEYSNDTGRRLGEWSVYHVRDYQDFTLTLEARTPEFTGNKWADFAVLFGWTDEKNYNFILFNKNPDGNQIFSVVDGERSPALATLPRVGIVDGKPHIYSVSRDGDTVKISMDDDELMSFTNTRLGREGKVGVGAYNDAAFFDDIKITTP